MAQNWKYFISGVDAQVDIVRLRKAFSGHYFIDGKYKGNKGVFAVTDTKKREYGPRKKSKLTKQLIEKGYFKEGTEIEFWAPACDPREFDISTYEKTRERLPTITVELVNEKRLKINPALGEPQSLIFGDEEEEEEIPYAALYSKSTEYGRLAYDLIYLEEELKHEGGILVTDSRVKKLVELAIVNSYSLPQDVWNWLSWISYEDIVPIYKAALGADERFLEAAVGGS